MRQPFFTFGFTSFYEKLLKGKKMSEFDLGFGGYSGFGDADTDRGKEILGQFYHSMQTMYPNTFKITFADLLKNYPAGHLEGIGLAANTAEMTASETNEAMFDLATKSNGQIPFSANSFYAALQGRASQVSAWKAVVETARGTLFDLTTGLEKVGQVVVDTGGALVNISKLTPYVLYAIVALFLWGIWRKRQEAADVLAERAIGTIKND